MEHYDDEIYLCLYCCKKYELVEKYKEHVDSCILKKKGAYHSHENDLIKKINKLKKELNDIKSNTCAKYKNINYASIFPKKIKHWEYFFKLIQFSFNSKCFFTELIAPNWCFLNWTFMFIYYQFTMYLLSIFYILIYLSSLI